MPTEKAEICSSVKLNRQKNRDLPWIPYGKKASTFSCAGGRLAALSRFSPPPAGCCKLPQDAANCCRMLQNVTFISPRNPPRACARQADGFGFLGSGSPARRPVRPSNRPPSRNRVGFQAECPNARRGDSHNPLRHCVSAPIGHNPFCANRRFCPRKCRDATNSRLGAGGRTRRPRCL
jgi:hypothetical protein